MTAAIDIVETQRRHRSSTQRLLPLFLVPTPPAAVPAPTIQVQPVPATNIGCVWDVDDDTRVQLERASLTIHSVGADGAEVAVSLTPDAADDLAAALVSALAVLRGRERRLG